MKLYLLCIALSFTTLFSCGQTEKNIILLTVRNDHSELASVIKFLNGNNPKLVCINVDLSECDQQKPHNLISNPENHEHHFDSLAVRSVTYPSEAEKQLSREFRAVRSLLMPSEVLPFGDAEYFDFIGCTFLYPSGVITGFINLISNEEIVNQVEKFQVSNTSENRLRYHFAVNIAFALNTEKTYAFIKSHENVVKIDFNRERKFDTYGIDDFLEKKVSGKVLDGKIIIIGAGQAGDYFLVRKKGNSGELTRISTTEIFANIACQIIDE